jgi:molybdate transport system substrate-binding protein
VSARCAAAVAVVLLLAAGCGSGAGAVTADAPLLIGAASDLQPAFTEIGERFADDTGEQVTFSFGSSGQLAQQLIDGAPMDLFASADVALVERVLDAGRGDPGTQATYAFGRIVIWSQERDWGGWERIDELVADADVTTISIANPAHAPYGRAAEEALARLGHRDAVDARLVFGENVSDAQRLVASGNADVGIIALSLAIAADERGEGEWVLVDEDLHEPLQQDLAVMATDPARAALAARFIDYVNGEQGRAVMRRFGFLLPDERLGEGGQG